MIHFKKYCILFLVLFSISFFLGSGYISGIVHLFNSNAVYRPGGGLDSGWYITPDIYSRGDCSVKIIGDVIYNASIRVWCNEKPVLKAQSDVVCDGLKLDSTSSSQRTECFQVKECQHDRCKYDCVAKSVPTTQFHLDVETLNFIGDVQNHFEANVSVVGTLAKNELPSIVMCDYILRNGMLAEIYINPSGSYLVVLLKILSILVGFNLSMTVVIAILVEGWISVARVQHHDQKMD